MDCVILAGNRENYREISDSDNKAFLRVKGRSILNITMEELRWLDEVERLLIVGPKAQLESHLEEVYGGAYPKPVLVFEQKNDLVANVMAVVNATAEGRDKDRYLLILPSDIPLMIVDEIRQFIRLCDMEHFDYVAGLTTETALSRFYPTGEKPGVHMAFFFCEDEKYRINNLHMVRPNQIRRIQYVRKSYAIRYQKRFQNMLGVVGNLVGLFGRAPSAIVLYAALQIARILHAAKWDKLARMIQKHLKITSLEYYLSHILGTRFKLVVTSFGGTAIDVDNEADYKAICERFEEWVAIQRALKKPGTAPAEE